MAQKLIVICTLLFLILLIGAPRAAAKKNIPLSTHSSEISVDPGSLDADLGFSIDEQDNSLLTLTVANLTPQVDGFSIDEIYFNTAADITQLKLKGLEGGGNNKNWGLAVSKDSISAADFGLFDISLVSKKPGQEYIGGGQIYIFTIEIKKGTPPYADADFFDISVSSGGTILAYGAAKFFDGPEEQIAYGAYALTPEPATILLLGLGGLALLRKRRV